MPKRARRAGKTQEEEGAREGVGEYGDVRARAGEGVMDGEDEVEYVLVDGRVLSIAQDLERDGIGGEVTITCSHRHTITLAHLRAHGDAHTAQCVYTRTPICIFRCGNPRLC